MDQSLSRIYAKLIEDGIDIKGIIKIVEQKERNRLNNIIYWKKRYDEFNGLKKYNV